MTMHADRALPIGRGGGSPPQASVPGGPGSAADVDPRQLLAGTLHVLSGPDRGRMWRLSPGFYVLGRAADSDLPVTDSGVSRRHCRVAVASHTRGQPGAVTVEDLGSNNGTLVNGVWAGQPTALPPGATIVVGHTTL